MELKVMLINGNEDDPLITEGLSAEDEMTLVGHCKESGDFLDTVRTCRPDVILIHTKAPDAGLLARIKDIRREEPCPVAMICDSRDTDLINAAVGAGIDALATSGMPRDRLGAIIDLALARFNKTHRLLEERDRAMAALAERKIIERAKGIIMKQRSLDEEAAYQFMRTSAMNRNVKLGQLAASIIEAEELLH